MQQTTQIKKKKQKRGTFAKNVRVYLLWVVVLTACFFLLRTLFSFYWRDRIDYARLDECQLVSYTALESYNTEELMKKDFRYIDEKMLIDLGVTAGWGVLYGGMDQDGLEKTLQSEMWNIDVLAVKDTDGFRVLIGDMSEDDFDERTGKMYGSSMEQGMWIADSAPGVNYEIDEKDSESCWVSCTFESTGYEVLVKVNDEEFIQKILGSIEVDLKSVVESCSVPDNGGLICISKATGEVKAVKGDLKTAVGDVVTRTPDANGFMTIGSERCIAAESSNDKYQFVAAIPVGASKWLRVFSAPFVAICFTILLLLSILYAWFLRNDILLGRTINRIAPEKGPDPGQLFRRSVRLLFLTLSVILSLVVLLVISLSIVDHTRMRTTGLLEDCYQYFTIADENEDVIYNAEDSARLKVADTINSMITQQPSLVDEAAMHDLGVALAGGVYVLNRNGAVEAGGAYWDYEAPYYDLSGLTEGDEQWKNLNMVLEGKADSQTADVVMNETVLHACGVQRKNAPGMLLYLRERNHSFDSDSMFSNFQMTEGRILFAINTEENEIISCSYEKYTGMGAEQFGMTKKSLKPGYVGTLQLEPGKYFVVTQQYSDILSCMGVSVRYMIKTYLLVVVLTVVTGILVAGLFLFLVLFVQMRTWPEWNYQNYRKKRVRAVVTMNGNIPSEDEPKDNGRFYDLGNDGLSEQTSADERWSSLSTPFSEMYAEDKFRIVLYSLIMVMLILIYWHPSFAASTGSHIMIAFLLGRSWEFGLNVYGIAYSLLMVITIFTITIFIRRFVLMIGGNFGNRGLTIAHLVDSFINYVAFIGGIAYGLIFLGVDTYAIVASVGIVGLGLSLGAKDLITDILAGIGIVFEGEFRNGDIIEIGGYRGTVIDIGIRTTKVLSYGNVKIFRNSEVSGVINLTQRYSFAEVHIQVARSEPLEKVEAIFRKELPLIQRRIPEMGDDIRMLGIVEMTAESVTLGITADCNETDRIKVVRSLYRELNLLMAREGILPKDPPMQAVKSVRPNPDSEQEPKPGEESKPGEGSTPGAGAKPEEESKPGEGSTPGAGLKPEEESKAGSEHPTETEHEGKMQE